MCSTTGYSTLCIQPLLHIPRDSLNQCLGPAVSCLPIITAMDIFLPYLIVISHSNPFLKPTSTEQ